MPTLTVRLSYELLAEIEEQQVSDEVLDLLFERALKIWLHNAPELRAEQEITNPSLFAESAVAFVDRLIDENRELFERLAKL